MSIRVLEPDEWEDAKGYHLFSPTQIDTFSECERKWGWRKIEKIYVPQNASAALGSKTHKILELYVSEGRKPDFVTDGEAAHIATSALHLLGSLREERAKDPTAVALEGEFRFQSPLTNFVYHGIRDLSVRPGIVLPELDVDGKAPVVGDYKTTKSINDYAKQTDDLLFDVQSTLYGYDAMHRWQMPVADLRWIYMQTKGTRKSHVTSVRLTSEHAAKNFAVIEQIASQMATALDKGKRPLELAPNPSACSAYGGCPYQHLCNDLTTSQKAKAKVSSSLIANLRARVQNQTAPAVEEKKEESVMGRADTDVPAPNGPHAFEKEQEPVKVNPPESEIAPPPVAEKPAEDKPKATRGRKPKADKDPTGADVHAHTEAPKAPTAEEPAKAPTAEEPAKAGFTLYVDCIPVGRAAKTLATFIEKAQEKIYTDGPRNRDGQAVGDYRLVGYGEGTPAFVGYVLEQIDGSTDLMLDMHTAEGQALLAPLMARASLVVRGLR